jgi:hypothetical protein
MKGAFFALSVVVCISLIASGHAWAQATAQIAGSVTDASGAVLPGVEITATQIDTGTTRTVVTNETGAYVLPSLPLGPYRLQAALPGFRTFAQTGIVLQVGSSPAINIVLEVGAVAETLEVVAAAALVETRNVGVGQVVETARVLELPLDGRNVTELIALAGAATPATGAGVSRNPYSNPTVSVAGGQATGLNYTLDGANHNDPFQNASLSVPFPDALQEFQVETSATSAQAGVRPAGTVGLVTKSGTNEFHGSLFHFVRQGVFNARNFFAAKRDTLKRNQFGGTAGGPIKQNKLFFFGAFQGTTIRQDPAASEAFVPTAAMLAGDFSTWASGQCQRRPVTLTYRGAGGTEMFTNNRINPALFSPAAVFLSSKLPPTTDPCGRVQFGNPTIEDRHMIVSRIDYTHSTSQSIFGRWLTERVKQGLGYERTKNLLNQSAAADGASHAFTLGLTSLYGPNVVNQLRLTANRFVGGNTVYDHTYTWSDLGVKAYTYFPGLMDFSAVGAFTVSAQAGPSKVAIFGLNDDVSIIRGDHQIGFGFHGSMYWANTYSTNYGRGRGRFTGVLTGTQLSDFLLGYMDEWSTGAPGNTHKRSKYEALYASDTWRMTPKVTLNYGLRWEPFFPMIHRDGSAVFLDMDAMRAGVKSSRFKNAPAGLFFIGDPQMPSDTVMKNRWWNFSPRLGLAWDVTGDGRTSVRASAGIFYDYPPMFYQIGLSNAAPWQPRTVLNGVNFDNPWAGFPGGDPHPRPFGKDVPSDIQWLPFQIVTAMDHDSPNTSVTHWNLSLQRQLGTNWLVSGNYIGNVTRHLWGTQPINSGVFIPGTANANGNCLLNGQVVRSLSLSPGAACTTAANTDLRRVFMLDPTIALETARLYGAVNRIDTGGTANYNGLVLSVQRRAAGGFTMSGNYTWSHCISDWWSPTANSGEGVTSWQTPVRDLERGNCTTGSGDRRHVFNTSAVAETPQFSSPTLKAVASGWRLATIFKVLSGSYMSVTTSRNPMSTGVANQRVDQVREDVYGNKTLQDYLSPAAFAYPTQGRVGNLGSGSILGPGTWQFDLALSRTFQVREAQRFEVRAEAFNVTNSMRRGNPGTSLDSGTFGQIRSALDPRIMQFALKYFF